MFVPEMQRAMLGEGGGEGSQLMELPLISKQAAIGDDEMTEEMLLKKTEKNRKRRLAAQKRKEKRKVCVRKREREFNPPIKHPPLIDIFSHIIQLAYT